MNSFSDENNLERTAFITPERSKNYKPRIILGIVVALTITLLIVYTSGAARSKASMAPQNCIFCDISRGKVPQTKLEVETDEFVIFRDIKPASKHHYLAVPKQHYESLRSLNSSHEALITRMEEGLKRFFESKGISTSDALFGFHMPPFITVNHLHMHGISPRSEIGMFYSWIFKPSTTWFKTAGDARKFLNRKEL